ncbi:MAG: DUF3501 family protein, partial [Alphaproteobacteria bacterium]
WQQIHEMLFIEQGGEDQIEDELDAYNPLIPQGRELVGTVMFEINDEARRKTVLGRLGGSRTRCSWRSTARSFARPRSATSTAPPPRARRRRCSPCTSR